MHLERHVRLFRSGHHQAPRLPYTLKLHADEDTIQKDGVRLIIEPVSHGLDLAALLAGRGPVEEVFPAVDEG